MNYLKSHYTNLSQHWEQGFGFPGLYTSWIWKPIPPVTEGSRWGADWSVPQHCGRLLGRSPSSFALLLVVKKSLFCWSCFVNLPCFCQSDSVSSFTIVPLLVRSALTWYTMWLYVLVSEFYSLFACKEWWEIFGCSWCCLMCHTQDIGNISAAMLHCGPRLFLFISCYKRGLSHCGFFECWSKTGTIVLYRIHTVFSRQSVTLPMNRNFSTSSALCI